MRILILLAWALPLAAAASNEAEPGACLLQKRSSDLQQVALAHERGQEPAFRSNAQINPHAPLSMAIHLDTTCGTCHDWLLDQFEPLWKDQEFREAMTKSFNITFWAHTITRHSQTFTLNMALDCAAKHFSQVDFVNTLLSWESQIEPWRLTTDSSDDEGGSGPLDRSIEEVLVKEDDLLNSSVPKRHGFDGAALVKNCLATEMNVTQKWVIQNTPADLQAVPVVYIDNVPQPGALENLRGFLCGQMGSEAPASCGSQSLLQREPPQESCERDATNVQSHGQALLQEGCDVSKVVSILSESEEPPLT